MFKEKCNWDWNCISLHIWLIMSSYGIIFAVLSFIEDIGGLSIKNQYSWVKGLIAVILGLLFYIIIGLPHLYWGKKHTTEQTIKINNEISVV